MSLSRASIAARRRGRVGRLSVGESLVTCTDSLVILVGLSSYAAFSCSGILPVAGLQGQPRELAVDENKMTIIASNKKYFASFIFAESKQIKKRRKWPDDCTRAAINY